MSQSLRGLRGPTLIESLHPLLDPELETALRDERRRDATILALVERHGMPILYPIGAHPQREEILDALPDVAGRVRRVRDLIWTRIHDAHLVAGKRAPRETAIFLRRFGQLLAGAKPKRRQRSNSFMVAGTYWGFVYRLGRAHALLAAIGTACSRSAKVKFAALASGVDEADFEERLRDSNGDFKRPLPQSEQAAIWTARRYGLTIQSVLNHVTPSKRRRFTTL
ncbi:MAG: hypothetical protein ABIY55_12125 [Kofleriaceae bacterium]